MAERSRGPVGAARAAARGAAKAPSARVSGEGDGTTEQVPAKRATSARKSTAAKTSEPRKRASTKAGRTSKQTAPARKTAAEKAPAKKAPANKAAATRRAATPVAPPTSLPVRQEEAPWTKAELEAVRGDIAAEVERLKAEIHGAEGQIAELVRNSGDGAGDDQVDSGSKAFEREHEMTIANNAREALAQNEHALERIADGTYGMCESCGNPIGKRRLQAFPRATLCLSCKQQQERH